MDSLRREQHQEAGTLGPRTAKLSLLRWEGEQREWLPEVRLGSPGEKAWVQAGQAAATPQVRSWETKRRGSCSGLCSLLGLPLAELGDARHPSMCAGALDLNFQELGAERSGRVDLEGWPQDSHVSLHELFNLYTKI